MAASKQQKCALAFAAICCILFGSAIITCGFLFQFLDDYDNGAVNGMDEYEYYYTQYWLGIPVGLDFFIYINSLHKTLGLFRTV